MPLGEALFSLRSIREGKPDPIPEADLRLMLEAARCAGSAGNRQPWHFVVVTDPALKAKLRDYYHESWWAWYRSGIEGRAEHPHPPAHIKGAMRLTEELDRAPVLILACAIGGLVVNEVLGATQNLLLAAPALGIGATLTRLTDLVIAFFGHEATKCPPNDPCIRARC